MLVSAAITCHLRVQLCLKCIYSHISYISTKYKIQDELLDEKEKAKMQLKYWNSSS